MSKKSVKFADEIESKEESIIDVTTENNKTNASSEDGSSSNPSSTSKSYTPYQTLLYNDLHNRHKLTLFVSKIQEKLLDENVTQETLNRSVRRKRTEQHVQRKLRACMHVLIKVFISNDNFEFRSLF